MIGGRPALAAALCVLVAAVGCAGEDGAEEQERPRVAVLLPGDGGSPRFSTQDRPALVRELRRRGMDPRVWSADDDPALQARQAEAALDGGARLLILTGADSRAAAAIVARAQERGVKVIDYDRLSLDAGSDFHVSFDGVQVGELQARTLAVCLAEQGGASPRVAMLHGDPDDSNARLFRLGYEGVARGLFESGEWRFAGEAAVPGYTRQDARRLMARLIERSRGRVDAVLAVNDTVAAGALDALRAAGLRGVQVTGQDATLGGLRRVLTGAMCMTVYKPIPQEAAATAEAARALLAGQKPESTGFVDDGSRQVPALLLDSEAITGRNVGTYAGPRGPEELPEANQICAGRYAAACAEIGL